MCASKDRTCTSCKYLVHFTRLCISRRKNVNIVDSRVEHNTDCNYPSEQPDVNNDCVNIEYGGVINAWSESDRATTMITL